ncbi:MAG: hypothetical protein FWC49_00945, partial [Proteobacteria bacterium]|nr:hypothetical protein [Pseudomonadota bacterium]
RSALSHAIATGTAAGGQIEHFTLVERGLQGYGQKAGTLFRANVLRLESNGRALDNNPFACRRCHREGAPVDCIHKFVQFPCRAYPGDNTILFPDRRREIASRRARSFLPQQRRCGDEQAGAQTAGEYSCDCFRRVRHDTILWMGFRDKTGRIVCDRF